MDYHSRRAGDEERRAASATDPQVRRMHEVLARMHRARADGRDAAALAIVPDRQAASRSRTGRRRDQAERLEP